MANFNYTLPSGESFVLRAPEGTTQAQADRIFYSQVAAGGLVGYVPGQTLTSVVSNLTEFQLSRLDRGTAGVGSSWNGTLGSGGIGSQYGGGGQGFRSTGTGGGYGTAGGAGGLGGYGGLGGNNGFGSIGDGSGDFTVLALYGGLPVVSTALPITISTPLVNPISQANVVSITTDSTGFNNNGDFGAKPIGPMTAAQVGAVQAQITNFVNQPSTAISDTGTGQYGHTIQQLEQTGYVKPSTSRFATQYTEGISGPTEVCGDAKTNYWVATGNPGDTFTWESASSTWYKAGPDPSWCTFMNQYAIWTGQPNDITTNQIGWEIYLPDSGTYTFNLSTDNYGSIKINNVVVNSFDSFTSVNTTTHYFAAGTYTVTLSITNVADGYTTNPGGIAGNILNPAGNEIYNTLQLIGLTANPDGFHHGGGTLDANGEFKQPGGFLIPGNYKYLCKWGTGDHLIYEIVVSYLPTAAPTFQFYTKSSPVSVLNAPGVWTGKNGIYSLNDYLSSTSAQNNVQQTLMQQAYDSLQASGVITPPTTKSATTNTGQLYSQYGLQKVSALSLLVNTALSVSPTALNAVTGTPVASLLSSPVLTTSTLSSGAVNNIATGSYPIVTDSSAQVTQAVTGQVAALVSNASKFGTASTISWAASGAAGSTSAALINSGINIGTGLVTTNLASSLTKAGVPPVITQSVTNAVNKTLNTTLNSQLSQLGKASTYASESASGVSSSLNQLGNVDLSNVISNGLDNVSNFVDSQVNNLTSGNFDASSLLNSGTIALASKALGISSTDAKNINTAVNLVSAITGGGDIVNVGLSLLGGSGVSSALTGLLGGSGALSSLTSLGSIASIGGLFGGGGGLSSRTVAAAGYNNTVNRSTVDSAVVHILGSNKIPTPTFVYQSAQIKAAATNITQAQNALTNLQSSGPLNVSSGSSIDLYGDSTAG